MSQSQVADVIDVHKTFEEVILRRMDELKTQFESGGPAKETAAKVAEEFRTFRKLVYKILGLLRTQVIECTKFMDDTETRKRRKALIFQGIPESEGEECSKVIAGILRSKLSLDIPESSIAGCSRLGVASKDRHRPVLVRFANIHCKTSVWRAKTRLKGSSISIREFLTRARQDVFAKARQHFGMRACWTQNGIIHVKVGDGSRHRVTSMIELNNLLQKFPKPPNVSAPSIPRSNNSDKGTAANLKI